MKIGSGLSIFKSDASGDSLNFPVICKIQFSTLFFTPLWPYVKLNTCPTTLSELTIAEGIKLNTQFTFLGESGIYNGALTSKWTIMRLLCNCARELNFKSLWLCIYISIFFSGLLNIIKINLTRDNSIF